MDFTSSAFPEELVEKLRQHAAESGPRIQRYEEDGRVFWIKRPEVLSLRMRLQKGDPNKAFAAEVRAHASFLEKGYPVAPIAIASETYLVTEDCGTPLRGLARKGYKHLADGLMAATSALAQMHNDGDVHGRPSLKDICWKDGQVAFLDFERAGRGSSAQDVQILLFSAAVETDGDHAAMALVRDTYCKTGNASVWQNARKRSRRLSMPAILLAPVIWCLPKNREYQAIRPFFKFIAEAG